MILMLQIGEVGDFGKVVLDENIKLDETILQKNGKFLDVRRQSFTKSKSVYTKKYRSLSFKYFYIHKIF
ncbi:hypothetical protein A1C_06845 [Rickettsia akari str. Hartford]|uniref:Uncharacterized protein n=1 Tax=Rickettsia akari (strain Hartford) TaxID=293614 RepID=A8GQB4_RICAH|nr:hypothetical protein [Rickettsia akari]ABV75589.1 hypothetical protein A1C_06845 [Rickettsia akari str. Hartford]